MKQLIKAGLARLGYHVQGTRYMPRHLLDPGQLRFLKLTDAVRARMFEFGQELTFIQVGAYDGVMADPLHKYIGRHGWRGVMLEPQPGPAERLCALYRENDRIVVLQAAVDGERGKRSMYTVESADVPVWAGGMASFQREHLARHAYLIPGIEAMIREISVDCITFDDVLARLPAGRLDLLQIDAEGADARILALFPFERIRPAIVHWEIKNLSKAQKEDCFDRLGGFGYRFAPSGGEDMLAVLD